MTKTNPFLQKLKKIKYGYTGCPRISDRKSTTRWSHCKNKGWQCYPC